MAIPIPPRLKSSTEEIGATWFLAGAAQLSSITQPAEMDEVHQVPLVGFYGIPLWDLSHTEEMIQAGRQQMEEYLQASGRVASSEQPSSRRAAVKAGFRGALRRLSHLRPGSWGARAA